MLVGPSVDQFTLAAYAELLFRQLDNFIHSTIGFFPDMTKLDG